MTDQPTEQETDQPTDQLTEQNTLPTPPARLPKNYALIISEDMVAPLAYVLPGLKIIEIGGVQIKDIHGNDFLGLVVNQAVKPVEEPTPIAQGAIDPPAHQVTDADLVTDNA